MISRVKVSLGREEASEKESFLDATQFDQRMVSVLSQTSLSQISMHIQIFIPVKASFF